MGTLLDKAMACAALLRSSARTLGLKASRRPVFRPRSQPVHAMAAPNHFILQYKYVPEILEKRDPHRQGHLDAIKKGIAEKKLVVAGAIADPVDGGLLIFQGVTKEEVEQYAKDDPYYKNGLISDYQIRPYLRVE